MDEPSELAEIAVNWEFPELPSEKIVSDGTKNPKKLAESSKINKKHLSEITPNIKILISIFCSSGNIS